MQSFRLCFGLEYKNSDREGNMDDKDWAQQTTNQIRKRRAEQQLKRQEFVAEEELKKAQGPVLWEDFKKELRAKAALIAHDLGEPDVIKISSKSGDEITAKAGTGTVTATFDRTRLAIQAQLLNIGKAYTAHVANGQVVFLLRDEGIRTADELAKEFVDALANYI